MDTIVAGYHIRREIGSGTYSTVFLALQARSGTLHALKHIKQFEQSEGFPRTTAREIKLLQRLRHPNIIALQDVIVRENYVTGHSGVYLVFEYFPHDLQSILHSPASCFALPPGQLKGYLYQMVCGLAYMHRMGVVHRDLKRHAAAAHVQQAT